jgi:hypothetical protein
MRPHARPRRVADTKLTTEDIPGPRASWSTIQNFALTMNGYARWRSFERCAEIGNGLRDRYRATRELPRRLSRLRTALFFEQRRYHHFGEAPQGDDLEYVRALVKAIRTVYPTRLRKN